MAHHLSQTIGENIRVERLRRRLNQYELAEMAGMSQVTLGRIERGREGVRLDQLDRIATALGLNVLDFLSEAIAASASVAA